MKLTTAVKSGDPFLKNLWDGMTDQVDKKSKEIIEKHRVMIEQELEAMRNEVVANVVLNISKYTLVHMLQDRLVIEVMDRREKK
jgi:glutamine synthetase type III